LRKKSSTKDAKEHEFEAEKENPDRLHPSQST